MAESQNPFPDSKFKAHEFAKADMTGVKFNGVDLTDSSFWAVLKNAQFNDCNLESSSYDDVNLSRSTFENVNLSNSRFNNLDMSGVSLSNLNLSNTEINDANLAGMKINGVLVTDLFDAYENQSQGASDRTNTV